MREVIDMISRGYFSPNEKNRFQPIIDKLLRSDRYMLLADYRAYIDCQGRVEELYRDPCAWNRKALLNVAHMGKFSSDRTINEYAEKIWKVKPVAG